MIDCVKGSATAPFSAIIQAEAQHLPLADNSVDICISSPPYNLGKKYGSDDKLPYADYLKELVQPAAAEIMRVLRSGGRACINVPFDTNLGGKQFVVADWHNAFSAQGSIFNTLVVWEEGNVSRRTAWGSWMSASDPWVTTPAEAILVYSKGTRKRSKAGRVSQITRDEFIEYSLGSWTFGGESAKRIGHPAPFPVELPRRLLKIYGFRNDVVLDPFVGSGSTLIAARELGMVGIGVDLSLEFCKLAERRLISTVVPPRSTASE